MLTVKEVAERYGIDAQQVRAWIHSGELVAIDLSKKPHSRRPTWRISEMALEDFEAARTKEAAEKRRRIRPSRKVATTSYF